MTAFQILAEPVRLFLVEELCAGEQTSGDLADNAHGCFGISWSAVSRHLVTLRRSGFVRVIPDTMVRWYCLEDDWLDRVDHEVSRLRETWARGEEIRQYDFADRVQSPLIRPEERRIEKRGRRAKTAVNRAERGVGRSLYAPGGDDTAAFE